MPLIASYAVDADDHILWTDEGFALLAQDHGRPELAQTAIGRPLAAFVAGDRPRALQAALINRARASAPEPIELRYRCDSPEMRRYAVLEIAARANGTVVFRTWFESVEPREYQALLDYDRPRGEKTVELCAWCNRFDVGGWREAEDAEQRLASELAPLPRVEHSVCDICELLLTQPPGDG